MLVSDEKFYRAPHVNHRRRIKTEEKAKVVAAAWGTALIDSIPCHPSYFAPGQFEE